MKPADTRLRHSLNLLSKFRPFLIVCIALLSIPIAAYLNSQRPVVSASMPDHLSANSIFTNSGSFTLGDQLGEPITVSMGGGMVWNTPFKVPIRVGDLTGKGVRSFVFHVRHEPDRLTPAEVPFEVLGTISEGMAITANIANPNHIVISGTATEDLTGSGTLIYLKFQGGGPPGLGSILAFEDYVDPQENLYPAFQFNDGSPAVTTTNGGVSFFWPIQGTMTPTPPPTATPSPTPTPAPTPCDLSFDSVNAPALPGDWSASSPFHPNYVNYSWGSWKTSNAGPDTPPNAAFAPNPWSNETMHLTSPSYFVPESGGGLISFRNRYDTEYSFDGMVFELSINGGPFQDILVTGGSFVAGGYNSVIGTGYDSTIEGRNAWSGNSNGYITTTVQLPPSAIGQFIRLKWTMASDNSVPGNGVWIDTITGLTCFSEPTPTPTETPTPTPTFTPTPTPMCTPFPLPCQGTPTPSATPTATPSPVPFTAGNIVVCRVGEPGQGYNSSSSGVFLHEYTPAGSFVQSVAVPRTPMGLNHRLSVEGQSNIDCHLTRSVDGRYLIVAGYDAAAGTASIVPSSVLRVFGRVDSSATFDTSTTTTMFSGASIRGAASYDGSGFWGVGSNAGVVYNTLGNSGPGTVVSSTITDMRSVNIFDGQLYVSSGSGNIRLGAVGNGLPTTAGETITSLPGLPTVAGSYNGFFFADLNAEIAGVDTLYIANDAPASDPATAISGGILKFSLVNGTWTYNGTFPGVLTPPEVPQTGFVGLTGTVSGESVTLFATRRPFYLIMATDSTGHNGVPISEPIQLNTTVSMGVRIRGLALAPVSVAELNATAFDYDGDNRSDVSVFRPASGDWYLDRSVAGFLGLTFGIATDRIVPADYDGDGKTDVAVYRPSEGVWYITRSSDGSYSAIRFGLADDQLAPADYDGDRKTDIAVFRPSDGTWYIANSSTGSYTVYQFGVNGDVPTLGDFDGDGRSDIAVFRPSDGIWYRVNSSDASIHAEQFGISTDRIVPADYDGDHETDIAVYRPSDGTWYIKNSAAGDYTIVNFGLSEDMPTPGDFDGDGKTDIAVFRPSNGRWYIANSSNGSYTIQQFGTSGDRPTQSAFGN